MLTTNDMIKLSRFLKEDLRDTFVTKEYFDENFAEIRQNFSNLQSSVDSIAQEFRHNSEERIVLGSRVDRAEDWIEKAGIKIGLKYKR